MSDDSYLIGKTVLGPDRSPRDSLTIWVLKMLFNDRIIVGPAFDQMTYDDCWCYHSREKVLAAFEAFEGEGEPVGWVKHPRTGRFRPDGDPAREYNQWERLKSSEGT